MQTNPPGTQELADRIQRYESALQFIAENHAPYQDEDLQSGGVPHRFGWDCCCGSSADEIQNIEHEPCCAYLAATGALKDEVQSQPTPDTQEQCPKCKSRVRCRCAIIQPDNPTPDAGDGASKEAREWTQSESGHSNSSQKYNELREAVFRLIMGGAASCCLSEVWARSTAGLIMAQLAHVHNVGPLTALEAAKREAESTVYSNNITLGQINDKLLLCRQERDEAREKLKEAEIKCDEARAVGWNLKRELTSKLEASQLREAALRGALDYTTRTLRGYSDTCPNLYHKKLIREDMHAIAQHIEALRGEGERT